MKWSEETRQVKSLKNIRWVEVGEVRGNVDGGKVDHWQVTIKLGFTLVDGGAG